MPTFPVAPTGPAVPTFSGGDTTFAEGDDTSTMTHDGWPFAFRVPGTWGCVPGKIDLPETEAWPAVRRW